MCRISKLGEVRVEGDSVVGQFVELIGQMIELVVNILEFREDVAMCLLQRGSPLLVVFLDRANGIELREGQFVI